jgi:hypothetical protein
MLNNGLICIQSVAVRENRTKNTYWEMKVVLQGFLNSAAYSKGGHFTHVIPRKKPIK